MCALIANKSTGASQDPCNVAHTRLDCALGQRRAQLNRLAVSITAAVAAAIKQARSHLSRDESWSEVGGGGGSVGLGQGHRDITDCVAA